MKAQAALIEALLSIAVLSLSITAFANSALDYAGSFSPLGINSSEIAYKLSEQVYANSTLRSCISLWNQSCMENLSALTSRAYGLRYFGIALGANTASFGSSARCQMVSTFCIPFGMNGTTAMLCMKSCV
ncbi:MAG: hypothetical protein KGH66_01235 [Candidatus Micrarchaeota archaeon]|nr:hypothetical protein [Candidatus Micrarchaeota archaeon]